jgi:hypothetical protein
MNRWTVLALFLVSCAAPVTGKESFTPARRGAKRCMAEVLHSEELPWGPIFSHRVRALVRITPPTGASFEVMLEGERPWQVPPPRRGKVRNIGCDPSAALEILK